MKNFPGFEAQEVLKRAANIYATTTVHSKFVPSATHRAHGAWIYDADRNQFLDFCSGVGVSNCGYGNRHIEGAMIRHIIRTGRLQYIHHDFHNPESVTLAEALSAELDRAVGRNNNYKIFLCNSGTEANEAGLKLALAARPERKKIMAAVNGFHGRTLGSLSLMTKTAHIRDYPRSFKVFNFPFPRLGDQENIKGFYRHLEYMEQHRWADEYNSCVLELVQGEGGIYQADPQALKDLQDFCQQHWVLLHIDEVQTGFGRTGKMFAIEHYPFLNPAIVTFAKSIANGYPVGAVAFARWLDWPEHGRHSNTFGGNALGAVAALATMDFIKNKNLAGRAAELGEILNGGLEYLAAKFKSRVANVRGLGLMRAIDFLDYGGQLSSKFRDEVVEEAYHHGLILIGAGEAAIRLMPPLVIKKDELTQGLVRLERAIGIVLRDEINL